MFRPRKITPRKPVEVMKEVKPVKVAPKPLLLEATEKYRVSLYELYTENRRHLRVSSEGKEWYDINQRFLKPLNIGDLNAVLTTYINSVSDSFDYVEGVQELLYKYKSFLKDNDRKINTIHATVEDLSDYKMSVYKCEGGGIIKL